MKVRLLTAVKRFADAVSRRCSEVLYSDATKRRAIERGWFVAVALLCLSAPACIMRQIHAEDARCARAMTAAAAVSEQAIHDEADRCHANLARIRR